MSNVTFKWLTVVDIKELFKITANVPEEDVDRAVKDALKFDIAPALSDAMVAAIKAILITNPKQWNAATTYVADDIVFNDGVYYKCVTGNTNNQPPSANWTALALMAFWTDYIRPYFVACAYSRFMLWHGSNVTQYGVRQNGEDTSVEISSQKQGALLADINTKKDAFLASLNKGFSAASQTFDGVKYERDCADVSTPNTGTRIWGVGLRYRR